MKDQKGISKIWNLYVGFGSGKPSRYPNQSNTYIHNLSIGFGYGYVDAKDSHPQNVTVDWKKPWKNYAIIKKLSILIPSRKPGDIGHTPRMFPPFLELENKASVSVSLCDQTVIRCSYEMIKNGPMEIKWFYPYETLTVTVWSSYPFIAEGKLFVEEFIQEEEEEN